MDIAIRGNVYEFSTTFLDAAGAPVNPASVTLFINIAGGDNPGVSLSMTEASDVWSADFDTTDYPPGILFWSVRAVTPHAADQGNFPISANLANT